MRRALVVDDDICIHDLAKFALETHGWQVLIAESGDDAIRVAHEHRPDVILLDLHMPIVDGATTLQRLKNDSSLRDIPVILMTAPSEANESNRLHGIEPKGRIAKPFDPRELSRLIEEKLQGK